MTYLDCVLKILANVYMQLVPHVIFNNKSLDQKYLSLQVYTNEMPYSAIDIEKKREPY